MSVVYGFGTAVPAEGTVTFSGKTVKRPKLELVVRFGSTGSAQKEGIGGGAGGAGSTA